MKSFLFFSAILFLSQATSGQEEIDRRMAAFVYEKIGGLANWMKENGHVPDRLVELGDSNFTLKSTFAEGESFYDFEGQFSDRYYHGDNKNIEAHSVESNLGDSMVTISLGFGDENDFIEGNYRLSGTLMEESFYGKGKFNRTNLSVDRMIFDIPCFMALNEEGYFEMLGCMFVLMATELPKFENFRLYNLRAEEKEMIVPVVEGWYNKQLGSFFDIPRTGEHYMSYMQEVFATTPAADIVGDMFTPKTVIKSTKKLGKSPKFTRKPYFNKEKKQWGVKVSYSYQ